MKEHYFMDLISEKVQSTIEWQYEYERDYKRKKRRNNHVDILGEDLAEHMDLMSYALIEVKKLNDSWVKVENGKWFGEFIDLQENAA